MNYMPFFESLETWRPIPSHSDYEASDRGRVRRISTGRVLSQRLTRGYPAVHIGKTRSDYVHRLVWAAFHGPIRRDHVINHIDGNPRNAKLGNLESITHADNMAHAARLGLMECGAARHCAKLNDAAVRFIKQWLADGEAVSAIAKALCVRPGVIYSIRAGRTWKHVTPLL